VSGEALLSLRRTGGNSGGPDLATGTRPMPMHSSTHSLPRQRLSNATTAAFAIGALPYGIKESGFSGLLLPYYNQTLGVPALWVSIALALGLLVDAVTDPIVGFLSDATRTRCGRRHPWMYASVAPAIFFTLLLWRPPSLSTQGLSCWLLVMAVATRTSVTLYEIPSTALMPELTDNYDRRTRLLSARFFCGYFGAISTLSLAYAVLLRPAAAAHGADGTAAANLSASSALSAATNLSAVGSGPTFGAAGYRE
jgi:GPH family glycoside/pentoside/hexuronide:cation symporter